ncbi:MAG TPA: hypothetical protein VIN69_02815 [Candidatus Limnocylindria bacterium]
MIGPTLELRPGVTVQYRAAESGEWREGTLVRGSPNDEEWLVENRFGKYWLSVSRLRPADELQEP